MDWTSQLGPEARVVARESMEFAFVAALLDTTVTAVNSALQRARKVLADRLPEATQQQTFNTLGEAAGGSAVHGCVGGR